MRAVSLPAKSSCAPAERDLPSPATIFSQALREPKAPRNPLRRRHAHPPDDYHRRHPPGEPFFRPAGAVPAGVARPRGKVQGSRTIIQVRVCDLMEDRIEEIRRLRGCINDLVSLLALPALWSGREPPEVLGILLDVLSSVLRLEFAYGRLNAVAGGEARHEAHLPAILRCRSWGSPARLRSHPVPALRQL